MGTNIGWGSLYLKGIPEEVICGSGLQNIKRYP